jgi:hypothetical protein
MKMDKTHHSMATQGDSVSLSVETEWLDSHPMAWAPHDFSSPKEAQTKPSYVIDIGERGVAEVEEALGAIKGKQGCLVESSKHSMD